MSLGETGLLEVREESPDSSRVKAVDSGLILRCSGEHGGLLELWSETQGSYRVAMGISENFLSSSKPPLEFPEGTRDCF